MSESIFDLLKAARQLAATGAATVFGVEIAIVTNVQDPDKQGRVKVCFPRLSGLPESSWARVAQPAAGPGRGFYWLPEVSDEVLVAFEMGQTNRPYVVGRLWNGKDKPMQAAYTDDNTTRMIQTKSGHQILLSDKDGEEKIVIADGSGKRVLTFDVKAKVLSIEAKEGTVELRAKKKIVLDCSDLEVKTRGNASLEAGTKVDLKFSGDGGIKAGGTLTLRGAKVLLNPSSLTVAELAAAALRAAARAAAAAAAQAGGAAGAGAGGAAGGPAAGSAGGNGATGGAGALARGATLPTRDVVGPGGTASSGGTAPPGGAAPAGGETPGAAPAQQQGSTAPAKEVAPGQLEAQVVNVAGTPQAGLEFEATLPDGTKRAGKTDGDGSLRLEGLPRSGECTLDFPDVKPAPPAEPSGQGRIRFVEGGVKVPIAAASVVEVPPRVRRCRMRGMHFETAKTFLLPSALVGIRQLVKVFRSFENIVGLVTGHTDRQGRNGVDASADPPAVEFNRGLSNERAESIKAFLLDQAETWMKWYAGQPNSKPWGVREDQHMLATVTDQDGAPFYRALIDGLDGPETQAAVRRFQEFSNQKRLTSLPVNGIAGPQTRLELVRVYMALEGTSLDPASRLESHGCGLSHPTPETEGDPALSPEERAKARPDQPVNRRVEVFLFEGDIAPPPQPRCPSAGCVEYAQWVAQKSFDVDLDQPPGSLLVEVTDEAGAPLPGAAVHLSGPLAEDGKTEQDGTAPFSDLPQGSYKVIAEKDGFAAADKVVEVGPGGPPAPRAEAKGLVSAPGGSLHGVQLQLKGAKAAKIELAVQLKTVFALPAAPTVDRWTGAPSGMLKGASVTIDGTAVKVATDALGKAVLDITGVPSGKHTLRVQPDAAKTTRGTRLPGPILDPAGPELGFAGAAPNPDFMYRPLALEIEIDDSGLKSVVSPAPRFTTLAGGKSVRLPDHFLVMSFDATHLVVDWKVDWIKTKQQQGVGSRVPKVLVIHHTAGGLNGDIDTLVKIGPGGAHYLVDLDGHAIKMAHESVATAHVGGDKWMGIGNLPTFSIGIEQTHRGVDPFPDEQVAGTLRLVQEVRAEFPSILRQAVAGHGEVEFHARGLGDPGPTFEWKMLEDNGQARTRITSITLPATIYGLSGPSDPPLKAGSKGPAVGELQTDLRAIGYDFTDPANSFGGRAGATDTLSAVQRFQVRFFSGSLAASRPKLGEVDFETAKAIKQVLADAPATVTTLRAQSAQPQPPPPAPRSRDQAGEGAANDDLGPGGPGAEVPFDPSLPVVHDGDRVQLSWEIKGQFDRVLLDPGGIDVTGATKDGKGSALVTLRRADAVDDAVPFLLTALLGDEGAGKDTATAGGSEGAPSAPDGVVALGRLLQDVTPRVDALPSHCIPARKDPAMTGTAFMKRVAGATSVADRDKEALQQFRDGNIPDFLRTFAAVKVQSGSDVGLVFVAPDYLAIGTDADFVRMPLLPGTAQQVVDSCCCLLPTAKLADDIFAQATTRIEPVSVPNLPGVQNGEVASSNAKIEAALAKVPTYKRGDLTTGPKKDIVLSLFLKKLSLKGKPIGNTQHTHKADDAVVIYGWHDPSNKGRAIQGEFDGHSNGYEDYSHGIRLVGRKMLVNGAVKDVVDVLKDKALAPLLCRIEDVKAPEFPLPEKYPQLPPNLNQKLTLQIIDAGGNPRPGVPYKLTVGAVLTEKQTDSNGMIDERIASASGKGTLEIDGQIIQLDIGGLLPIGQLAGVQGRLNNLGFLAGSPTGQLDEPTKEALLRFQGVHGLQRTGTVTPETQTKLQQVYGA